MVNSPHLLFRLRPYAKRTKGHVNKRTFVPDKQLGLAPVAIKPKHYPDNGAGGNKGFPAVAAHRKGQEGTLNTFFVQFAAAADCDENSSQTFVSRTYPPELTFRGVLYYAVRFLRKMQKRATILRVLPKKST